MQIAAGGLHSITIPTCIPDGLYLLRAELIALHAGKVLKPRCRYARLTKIQPPRLKVLNFTWNVHKSKSREEQALPARQQWNSPALTL
jgi:hypothetical protein